MKFSFMKTWNTGRHYLSESDWWILQAACVKERQESWESLECSSLENKGGISSEIKMVNGNIDQII